MILTQGYWKCITKYVIEIYIMLRKYYLIFRFCASKWTLSNMTFNTHSNKLILRWNWGQKINNSYLRINISFVSSQKARGKPISVMKSKKRLSGRVNWDCIISNIHSSSSYYSDCWNYGLFWSYESVLLNFLSS